MEVDKEGLISYNQYVHAVREMFQGDLKQLELQSMAAQPSQHNYNNITVLQSSHKVKCLLYLSLHDSFHSCL